MAECKTRSIVAAASVNTAIRPRLGDKGWQAIGDQSHCFNYYALRIISLYICGLYYYGTVCSELSPVPHSGASFSPLAMEEFPDFKKYFLFEKGVGASGLV